MHVRHASSPPSMRALSISLQTVGRGIPPTTDAYNAASFASACSGNKLCVSEAFCLANQMIDDNCDAYRKSAFVADWRTFCTLLEGTPHEAHWGPCEGAVFAENVANSMYMTRSDVVDVVVSNILRILIKNDSYTIC